jgi:2-polyprenyl-3-methyl-5-hydroxy-6-metoxy-1,4-benzoquinol methylase
MNYKLLFPTYRNRYLFIKEQLNSYASRSTFEKALNLGTGEGDYDHMIAGQCEQLVACDINEADIEYAKALNADVGNIAYRIEDALNLSFEDNSFGLIISVDVIEHVGQPERMLEEISRVLKPGGIAMITFPSLKFPITYDPINRILSWFGNKKIPQGAYAFGHEYLIDPVDFNTWSGRYGMEVLLEHNLSGYLVALLEMYWTGIIQRVFKANSSNLSGSSRRKRRCALQ